MRNKKLMIAGLITLVMGISMIGCGNGDKSAEETVTTEQVTETDDYSYEDATDDDDVGKESTEFTMPVYEDFTLESGLSESYRS